MSLNHTQKEIELEISKILIRKDITDISNLSGIGYSYIDQQLNPNDERKSYIYGALQIICALDEISPERGEELWQLIRKIRESSKPLNTNENLCVNTELAKSEKEFSDVWKAKLNDKSLYEQLTEAVENEAQAIRLKEAILTAINKERETCNSSRSRLKAV